MKLVRMVMELMRVGAKRTEMCGGKERGLCKEHNQSLRLP